MYYNMHSLKEFRKALRKNMTPAEIKLWSYLKNRQLSGFKFRRQYSIEAYILDFYCPAMKLGIEVDGDIHNLPAVKKKDAIKNKFFEEKSITIIHVNNKDVFQDIESVLKKITNALKEIKP